MHLKSRKSPAPHPLVPPSLPYCGHGALAHWFSVMRATEEPSHIRTCGMRIFMLHSCLCSQDTEHKRREVVTPGRSRCNLSRGGFSLLPGSLTVRSCRQHSADGAQPELGKQPRLARPLSFQSWAPRPQEELTLTVRALAFAGLFTSIRLSRA